MPSIDLPRIPAFLRKAVLDIFRSCLRCGEAYPLEVAHIINRPQAHGLAQDKVNNFSATQVRALTECDPNWQNAVLATNAWRYHHDLAHMVALCPTCHTLFDGEYDDVTEAEIIRRRDEVLLDPEILGRVIAFVQEEMKGRRNRCICTGFARQTHKLHVDLPLLTSPLTWIAAGYRAGVLVGEPYVIEAPRTHCWGYYFDHVHIGGPFIMGCMARLGSCGQEPRAAQVYFGVVSTADVVDALNLDPQSVYEELVNRADGDPLGLRQRLRMAAQLDDPQLAISDRYHRLKEKMFSKAIGGDLVALLENARQSGEITRMTGIASMMEEAGCVREAAAAYRAAAELGSPLAMHECGCMAAQDRDPLAAERWWRAAIDAEPNGAVPQARHNLAYVLAEKGDLNEAIDLYTESANGGNHGSMNNLAALLKEIGRHTEARRWLNKAARAGNANAMFTLGDMEEARGRKQSAQRWWRKAAEDYHPLAMISLAGQALLDGRMEEADYWCQFPITVLFQQPSRQTSQAGP